jgi:hypothetical protein
MNWNELNDNNITTPANITRKLNLFPLKISQSNEPQDELFRFISINLICIVSIMVIMSFCYISHVFYNKAWKPYFL